jgi:putative DNA primase/helicase
MARITQAVLRRSERGNDPNDHRDVPGYLDNLLLTSPSSTRSISTQGPACVVRTYDDILADAETLKSEAAPEVIEALIVEAARLNPIQREQIFKAIKKGTRLSMGAIKEAAGTAFQEVREKPDHLTLARSVIDSVGAENVIGTQSHVWGYQETGVWRPLEPRGEKQMVQGHLDVAHRDQSITKHLVDSVTDTLRNEVYRAKHEWNVGPADGVAVKNGELILRNGKWGLEPHCRDYYRTVLVPVEFDERAACPRFARFLQDIFAKDSDREDKAKAILEMIGYTLMSHAAMERFALLVGNGANGKSVLLAVIEALCGSGNVTGVQPSKFENTFQRAHLHLKLANIVTEIKQGEVIADAALKSIVSGEPTTVEHKFRDPFEFRPYATCWFGTNHLPHTRDFSDALFRRALVVPFNRRFTPGIDADPRLKHKLIAELPGIMNLALNAYARVIERGAFTEPQSCCRPRRNGGRKRIKPPSSSKSAARWGWVRSNPLTSTASFAPGLPQPASITSFSTIVHPAAGTSGF